MFVAGIGLPGVAASGTIAANTLVTVGEQRKLMEKLRRSGLKLFSLGESVWTMIGVGSLSVLYCHIAPRAQKSFLVSQ